MDWTKIVVSISLGSDRGNKKTIVEIMGVIFLIARIGVNGDMKAARQLIRYFDSLDENGKTALRPPPGIDVSWIGINGPVDAMGLGGTDIYVWQGNTLREGLSLAREAKRVPLLDGYGLKMTLEKLVIEELIDQGMIDPHARVLLTSAIDREGMAIAFDNALQKGEISKVIYGDLIYMLGLPIPLESLSAVGRVADTLLPIFSQLPIWLVYPTGEKQKERAPKFEFWQEWATVIAGDCHQVMKHLPFSGMQNTIMIVNTTTKTEVEEFKQSGLRMLVTTTPEFEGRTFGTNLMETVAYILAGNKKDPESYLRVIKDAGWGPNIIFQY